MTERLPDEGRRTARRSPLAGVLSSGRIEHLAAAAVAVIAVGKLAATEGGYFPTSWGWTTVALALVVCTWALAGARTDLGWSEIVTVGALALFIGWTGLSNGWSIDPAQTVIELERIILPFIGCVAFLVLARRASVQTALHGILAAITAVALYALATRLIPSRFGAYDPVATYRLSQPIGYWNGLGIFLVMGILIAFGCSIEVRARLATRAAAAAALVPLLVALLFTYSRGAWLALALGLAVVCLVSPRRLAMITLVPVLAASPAIAVAVAAHSNALTHQHATAAAIAHQGYRLCLVIVVLAGLAAALVLVVRRVEARIDVAQRWSRTYAGALIVVGVALIAIALVRIGGPQQLFKRGYDSFTAAAPSTERTDLNQRLLSLNGNGRAQLWSVALDATKGHLIAGTGAGSFARNWERSLKADFSVRDAHGLYIETLSELGLVGLLLLVVALVTPLAVGVRLRQQALIPALLGAYAAFLFHIGIDWEWELTAVALTGLLIGSLILVSGRSPAHNRKVAWPARGLIVAAALGVAAFGAYGAIGNGALGRAQTANDHREWALAASNARVARRWMPWSTDPLLALGTAQLGAGDAPSATLSFRQAISLDQQDWQAWLDLAASTQGATRRRAVTVARGLYPHSPEVTVFENELADAAAEARKAGG